MKTAILGVWHVHTEDYLKTAMKYGEVVGVYDENESKRKEFCEKWGLKEFECLEELLQNGKLRPPEEEQKKSLMSVAAVLR